MSNRPGFRIDFTKNDQIVEAADLDDHAAGYVKLAFALSRHDPEFIDGYFGHADLRTAARGYREGSMGRDDVLRWLRETMLLSPDFADGSFGLNRSLPGVCHQLFDR